MARNRSGCGLFAIVLRDYRSAANLTQENLAERSGLSVHAISMLERGVRRAPRPLTLELLAGGMQLDATQRTRLVAAARGAATAAPPTGESFTRLARSEQGSMPEAAAAATRTLPRDVTLFTGREDDLSRLLAVVSATVRTGRVVGISAVDGMAGVGKSAFAIHAAHHLSPEFPDGQLFLDLHAHTAGQDPVAPGSALRSLLLSVGVDAGLIPPDVDGRAALWRDRLAGRRMLILLDDAAGHEQVRPLIPGAGGCLVLTTSRRRLALFGAVEPLELDTLSPAASAELFHRLVGHRARDAEPGVVSELVHLCGYLPLAICLLAARLRGHPSWTVRHLKETVERARDRLTEMRAENVAVAAACNLSYQNLRADRQRLFRRLGLHPGRDIDVHAAAALDGADLAGTEQRLEALYDDHLVEEPLPGRYRLHDLIRDYARDLASQDAAAGNASAVDRLLDYYLHTTTIANRQFAPGGAPTTAPIVHLAAGRPDVSSHQKALRWLEGERANLNATIDHAATHGRARHATRLAREMQAFLRIAGHWDQALASRTG